VGEEDAGLGLEDDDAKLVPLANATAFDTLRRRSSIMDRRSRSFSAAAFSAFPVADGWFMVIR
jgi:hypothetical protein